MWEECVRPLALDGPVARALWPLPLIRWASYGTPLGSAILHPASRSSGAQVGTVALVWHPLASGVPGPPGCQACGTDSASGRGAAKSHCTGACVGQRAGQWGLFLQITALGWLHLILIATLWPEGETEAQRGSGPCLGQESQPKPRA